MLFTYRFIPNHKAYRLQKYLNAFFETIKSLDSSTPFSLDLFCSDFQKHLSENKLKKQFECFYNIYVSLSIGEKESVINAFTNNNNVEDLCQNNALVCIKVDSLPASIQRPSRELFEYLYEHTLRKSDFDIQNHYQEFLKENKKICGFCGIDSFVEPSIGEKKYQQDYDHLLDKGTFPFASINFNNIIPVCKECNSRFKGKRSILLDSDGIRRRAFYPYLVQNQLHRIQVICSTPPRIMKDDEAKWDIAFAPYDNSQQEEIETWITVYNIKGRYEGIVKDAYDKWLINFLKSHRSTPLNNTKDIQGCITKYRNVFLTQQYQDKNFLKVAYFDYLLDNAPESFYASILRYYER